MTDEEILKIVDENERQSIECSRRFWKASNKITKMLNG